MRSDWKYTIQIISVNLCSNHLFMQKMKRKKNVMNASVMSDSVPKTFRQCSFTNCAKSGYWLSHRKHLRTKNQNNQQTKTKCLKNLQDTNKKWPSLNLIEFKINVLRILQAKSHLVFNKCEWNSSCISNLTL